VILGFERTSSLPVAHDGLVAGSTSVVSIECLIVIIYNTIKVYTGSTSHSTGRSTKKLRVY